MVQFRHPPVLTREEARRIPANVAKRAGAIAQVIATEIRERVSSDVVEVQAPIYQAQNHDR